MSGTVKTTVRDPVTGQVDYEYTTGTVDAVPGTDNFGFGPYVISAVDYDLAGQHPWSSYTIHNTLVPFRVGPSSQQFWNLLTAIESRMDDGSLVQVENAYGSFRFSSFLTYQTTTVTDAVGAPVSVTGMVFAPFSSVRDYAVTNYASGRVVSADYDATTGNLDYVLLSDPNGHTIASDYEAATGRLDYVVEHFSDGRTTVTDYDLADQHPWTSYTINYDASGNIVSVMAL